MMRRNSIGTKLYLGVISVFLIFAVAFVVFQQMREKQFKVETLNLRLQSYNEQLEEAIRLTGKHDEKTLTRYVRDHHLQGLRLTLIDMQGRVIYDNMRKDYQNISNHRNRPEIVKALRSGSGSTVERNSETLKGDFFYSATFFPEDSLIIRSALPYDVNLAKSLKADQHFLWFAIVTILVLVIFLYRYTSSLGKNITKLRIFAYRADHNESLDTEDLINFPDDELGEIAERIIKIYKRLQSTRKEQDKLKRQLTQNIAHELKTPVASIQGYVETLLENKEISDEVREQFLQRCFVQCQRLTALLQDISTLNKMDDGARMQDKTDVDIVQTIDTISKETALQLQDKGMQLETYLPDTIMVKGNPSLIYSIFRNLIDNAIAYAGRGSTVTIKAEEEGELWKFMFADNGVGVAPEHLPRIFERFYRVDKGRSRKMGGTGLGLAIVKNAVILHGGTIRVCNQEGGGLRFDFTLQKA